MKRISLTQAVAIIIAAIITGVFGLIYILATPKDTQDVYVNLPAAIPSITPKPTVVGTPIIGADIAVGGKIDETISANDVTLVVDGVNAYTKTLTNGYTFNQGYAFVVVKVRVSNVSSFYIVHQSFKLIDSISNEYVSWSVMGDEFGLPNFPAVSTGQSGAGALVFQVPESALSKSLRLSLKLDGNSEEPSTLLIVFFGDVIPLEQQ